MGFYHPATLVKDAQRRGVRFHSIDVQISDWTCGIQSDGGIRLGLMHVHGLRSEAGQSIARARAAKGPFRTLDDLATRTGVRQEELRTLAEIGALTSFGGDRRTALWQADRVGRAVGPLLRDKEEPKQSPLPSMTLADRIRADYEGTGLTIGPHPMAVLRSSLANRGVARAIDLAKSRAGRRVRIAGAVITRQRPGTAKGFVFLTMEDETGLSNVIITPDVYATYKRTVVDEPYLLIEGTLQNQDGAVSVKAEKIEALKSAAPQQPSHDFR
jgi:error-prone DNA polymerase